jgi:hypothetical protein
MDNFDRLIWLMAVFGLALALAACEANAGPKDLAKYAAKLGYKAPNSSMAAISEAARLYGLDETKMLRIAIVESSLNHKALNKNTNGTVDVGLFQINSVNYEACEAFNIYNVRGNAMCAALLLSIHKKSGDPFYIGRYHSLTLDKKLNYYKKVQELK